MATSRKPVVVITGASKGIGLAVTTILLEQLGANVVAISRTRSAELVQLLQKHSASLLTIECNVADEGALTRAIVLAEKTYQHVDGLVLNAAVIDPMGKITAPATSLGQWKEHFDVNFFSLITALRAASPALRNSDLGGRVVFVSSGSATGGLGGWAPYNASKAAMNSLCRTFASEEPDVVAVALRPGMVDTSMQVAVRGAAEHMSKSDQERFVKAHAEGKLVRPEDAGYVIASLAIKAPKSLSGQFVSWDGQECAEFRRK